MVLQEDSVGCKSLYASVKDFPTFSFHSFEIGGRARPVLSSLPIQRKEAHTGCAVRDPSSSPMSFEDFTRPKGRSHIRDVTGYNGASHSWCDRTWDIFLEMSAKIWFLSHRLVFVPQRECTRLKPTASFWEYGRSTGQLSVHIPSKTEFENLNQQLCWHILWKKTKFKWLNSLFMIVHGLIFLQVLYWIIVLSRTNRLGSMQTVVLSRTVTLKRTVQPIQCVQHYSVQCSPNNHCSIKSLEKDVDILLILTSNLGNWAERKISIHIIDFKFDFDVDWNNIFLFIPGESCRKTKATFCSS